MHLPDFPAASMQVEKLSMSHVVHSCRPTPNTARRVPLCDVDHTADVRKSGPNWATRRTLCLCGWLQLFGGLWATLSSPIARESVGKSGTRGRSSRTC